MLLIYEFTEGEDPASLSKVLWKYGIGHRIMQGNGRNQLWLVNPAQSHDAMAILQSWQASPDTDITPARPVRKSSSSFFVGWRRSPVTIVVLLLSFFVALLTGLGEYLDIVSWFTITSFDIVGNRIRFLPIEEVWAQGEYWRLLTPAFLHFGAAHLIFNSLWVWDIGRRVERLIGSLGWLCFAVIVCVVSNVGQFVINGYPLFGGLSGLVYGLVGFAWLAPILVSAWPEIISKPLMVFFAAWLVLGYTDILASFGLGNMANEAHLLGLISGLVLAAVFAGYHRLFKRV